MVRRRSLRRSGVGASSSWVVPFDQAVDFYTAQIRPNPAVGVNYSMRAGIWQERGELDIAIADYNEAIRLDPQNEVAYSNRGLAWVAKKEHDRAIADYDEAIRLDPKYTLAYNNRDWLRATCPEAKYRDGKAAVVEGSVAPALLRTPEAELGEVLAPDFGEETGRIRADVPPLRPRPGEVSRSPRPLARRG